MRRTTGVVVVLVGAVLGAGSGVLANDVAHRAGSGGVRVADVVAGGSDGSGGPVGPGVPSSRSGSPPPTAATDAADAAGPVTAARLLSVRDLATAGWDTRSLVARTQTGEGALPTGVCQRESLVARPGAGTRVRVDLVGRWTSAHEVAATFADDARAQAAYDALRADLAACRTGAWSPPGGRVAVGPEVPIVVPSPSDRGVWSSVAPATSPTTSPTTSPSTSPATSPSTRTATSGTRPGGVMAVLLVGRRVAVVQVDDPSPKPATVGTILSLAARRLAG